MMPRLLRHVLAIAALPFVVAVLIPWWLVTHREPAPHLGATWLLRFAQVGGVALLLLGLALFAGSLRRFASEGRGTLAPWDPPRHLVVTGLYRYVRNPMITGVLAVLLGEALILLSRPVLEWALIFLLINAMYIPLVEEPLLTHRFGEPYREYRRHVPRLIPRLRPWHPESPDSDPSGTARTP
jgi:protein-S-isoprenylcysteine O-methyltransferase Ste14